MTTGLILLDLLALLDTNSAGEKDAEINDNIDKDHLKRNVAVKQVEPLIYNKWDRECEVLETPYQGCPLGLCFAPSSPLLLRSCTRTTTLHDRSRALRRWQATITTTSSSLHYSGAADYAGREWRRYAHIYARGAPMPSTQWLYTFNILWVLCEHAL